MEKIPTIFERDWDGDRSRVLDLPNQTADVGWVFAGEGVATRKYDGTCVMFDGVAWWARREVKEGKEAPANFHSLATDSETDKTIGWEPVGQSGFAKWFYEAVEHTDEWIPGTYELCGPKVNKNAEGYTGHVLIEHASADLLPPFERSFAGIRDMLADLPVEGIVFHHPDGRMAKIKARDFGIRRLQEAVASA